VSDINGNVINLMANDVGRFDYALAFLHDLWKGPVETALVGVIIYQEIGLPGIIGLVFLLLFIPLQGLCEAN